jgi:radical SAM superfamily enzyme YgiQ (UPF0313 family)
MSRRSKGRPCEAAAEERNLCPVNRARALLKICLVYPNHYRTGMSSLGFQTVYRLLATHPGIRCERAFLPERADLERLQRTGTPLLSLEGKRPLADFDLIAFSTSFEPDYVNLPLMLHLSRIPLYSSQRDESHPLVMAGGAALFLNPEPVADFLDLICIGEGEEIIPSLLSALLEPTGSGRRELLTLLSRLPGIYVPAFHHPRYESGSLVGFDHEPAMATPVPRVCGELERHPPAETAILTDNTEFGDMYLVEVSRGCPHGCRFCAAGFIYGRFRQQPLPALMNAVERGLEHRKKIGLVGAAVSDYRGIGRLCRHIVERGARVSVSSLRIDRIDPEMLDALVASGHRTISLAPEGGSQRLRDLIRKNLNEGQILDACERIIARDILNLRLYFIIGLPTESEADLEELVRLVTTIRERVVEQARANRRLGEITLSINPFIPKPFTPFQWCGMEPLSSLEAKVKFLERSFRGMANLQLKVENLKGCYLQALLSRGDRRCSCLLERMARGATLKQAARECAMDTDALVRRTIPLDDPLPWDLIGSADKEMLKREHETVFVVSRQKTATP